MTNPDENGAELGLETTGLRPESPGGAGLTEEGAPIGFTAEVGGVEVPVTDDPAQVRHVAPEASERGPTTDGERTEGGDPQP
jgi:hypothetical protein